MTGGLSPETLDGISSKWIDNIINEMRDESFQFQPARRIMIPKANGKMIPLTIASPRDKIVQQVMYKILMPIFEPTFSSLSHGFRPNLGCHSALKEVFSNFQVDSWVIEGDIKACFDSFDNKILMNIIGRRVKDQKMINLLWKSLRVGYGERMDSIEPNIIGTPQELKLDFDKGIKAARCKEYHRIATRASRARRDGKLELFKELRDTLRNKSSIDKKDPLFRRLTFVRYADDWIIGIRGSRKETEKILQKCKEFLKKNLNLDLSLEKTKITNLSKDKILF